MVDAAALAGVSKATLTRRLAEEAVGVLRHRQPRKNALSLEDREEIRVGIDRRETDAEIGRRLGPPWGDVTRGGAGGGCGVGDDVGARDLV